MLPGASRDTHRQGGLPQLSPGSSVPSTDPGVSPLGSVRIRKPHTAFWKCIWVSSLASPGFRHVKNGNSLYAPGDLQEVFRITVLDTPRHLVRKLLTLLPLNQGQPTGGSQKQRLHCCSSCIRSQGSYSLWVTQGHLTHMAVKARVGSRRWRKG